VLTLEGRSRPVDRPEPIRAPIPVHGASIVNRLLGLPDIPTWADRVFHGDVFAWRRTTASLPPYERLEQMQASLAKTQDRPTEVTRSRRAAQLILTVLALNLPGAGLALLLLSPYLALRKIAQGQLGSEEGLPALGFIMVWPAVWVLWAFLFRGGYAFSRGGLALRRADGRPPSRLQCAWRAFLVWAPVAGMLGLALWLGDWVPERPALYFALYFTAVALLLGYAVLAILFPTRSLNDRLAGTYLVSR
jgi:hypothetical protein